MVQDAEFKMFKDMEDNDIWRLQSLTLEPVDDVSEHSWQALTQTFNENNQECFTTDMVAANIGPELALKYQ